MVSNIFGHLDETFVYLVVSMYYHASHCSVLIASTFPILIRDHLDLSPNPS